MLLAIDTSTAQMGLALYDGTSVPGEFVWHSGLHHTQELAPTLAELLKRVGIKIECGQCLGCGTWPRLVYQFACGSGVCKRSGARPSYTNCRHPTLDIVATAVPLSDRRLAAVVHAGRGRLALGWYNAGETAWQADGPIMLTTADDLAEEIHKPVIVCGEMSTDERHRLARKFKNVTLASPAQCVRRPGILAELAWQKWQAGQIDPAAGLAPIYLHVAGGLPA